MAPAGGAYAGGAYPPRRTFYVCVPNFSRAVFTASDPLPGPTSPPGNRASPPRREHGQSPGCATVPRFTGLRCM